MKYEDFKLGGVFRYQDYEETVILKNDRYRIITTIDSDTIPTAWEEEELYLLKPVKEELPEEGLLVSGIGSLVYKLSDGSGYGFVLCSQSNYVFDKIWDFSIDNYWKQATPEQKTKFVEMLKKECEKRGLFENTKLEKCGINSYISNVNEGVYNPVFRPYRVWNKNGRIFDLGKFATPRKETTTTPQVGKQYTHKKGNTYTVLGFTNDLGDREDKDFPVTVIYVDQEGRHWSRPLSRWHDSFKLKE